MKTTATVRLMTSREEFSCETLVPLKLSVSDVEAKLGPVIDFLLAHPFSKRLNRVIDLQPGSLQPRAEHLLDFGLSGVLGFFPAGALIAMIAVLIELNPGYVDIAIKRIPSEAIVEIAG